MSLETSPFSYAKFQVSLSRAGVRVSHRPSQRALTALEKLDQTRERLTPVQFEALRGYIIHRDRESQKFVEMMDAWEQ